MVRMLHIPERSLLAWQPAAPSYILIGSRLDNRASALHYGPLSAKDIQCSLTARFQA